MRVARGGWAIGVLVLLNAARARALPAPEEEVPPPPPEDSEKSRLVPPPQPPPKLPPSIIGVQATLGGGATGFLERNVRNFIKLGGAWGVRVAAGTRWPFVVEAAYMGSIQSITNIGIAPNALLVGNGAEADVRFNPVQSWAQPYLLAGAGWMNYRVVNNSVPTADIQASDNVIVLPVGFGVAAHWDPGFVVDVRGTVRLSYNNALLPGMPIGSDLHSWNIGASLGWEF